MKVSDVVVVDAGTPVYVDGLKGKQIYWLAADGSIEGACIRADYLEVPSFLLPKDTTFEAEVERVVQDCGVTPVRLVRWVESTWEAVAYGAVFEG